VKSDYSYGHPVSACRLRCRQINLAERTSQFPELYAQSLF
jgi:hypothetical protein